ncbi:MAG TPA: hypothetical protein VNO14_19070 [Blastocatellia bacterium]|nr:hypothetical protein [Blastocatellia bacterium]
MRTTRWYLRFGLGLLLLADLACTFSFTTANISSLRLGKDKGLSQETSSFTPGDTIYAVAVISNAPSKVKVKGRLVVEDVAGQKSGPVPGLETEVELASSGTATFTFSPPPTGWPKGGYKVEALMLNENGEQKDQEAASFTVN